MNKTPTKKNLIVLTDARKNEEVNNTKEFPYQPGNNVINNILNFSKALNITKSKSVEHFETVLN